MDRLSKKRRTSVKSLGQTGAAPRVAPLRHYVVGAILLACAVCLSAGGAKSSGQEGESLDSTRMALAKWVDVRRLISKEKRDLALAKEMLTERIELLHREIESLQIKIGQAEESIAEADEKRMGMLAENEKLKQGGAVLAERATALEASIKQLLVRLPDPIRERVKPLSQQLPEDSGATELSVSERFQNILGILNEVNRFNGEITVTSEVRLLSDGTSVEVTALYVGISQGYYVGANDSVAGTGVAGSDRWMWSPANEAAAQIAKVIAIARNEQVASFVRLPIEIK